MAFSTLVVKIAGEITSLDAATRKAVERVKTMGNNLSSIGSSLSLAVSAPIIGLGAVALKSAGDIEALKLGLVAVTGSSREAERQFVALREVAKLPGLGFQEAVRGATNLQAVGFSAEQSKNLLLQFGNALASVGRGREDLNEVIRQLGQLGSRGKVTADNLKPIIERVPQVAAIIKREFGTIDTEALQKLGLSSTELIATLERELGKLPRVTGGINNEFENLRDTIDVSMAAAGEALKPFALKFIKDFATPLVEMVPQIAKAFSDLSPAMQGVTLALGALAVAAPVAVYALGTLITNFGVLAAAIGGISWPVLAGAMLLAGVSASTLAHEFERVAEIAKSKLDTSLERATKSNTHFEAGTRKSKETVLEFVRGLDAIPAAASGGGAALRGLGEGADKAEQSAQKLALQMAANRGHFAAQTTEAQVLARMLSLLNQGHDEMIDRLARVRLGLINMWDGLPQFEVANVAVQKLGDGLRFVRDGLEGAANALRVVDFSKLDISPRKQNEALFGEDAKKQQKEYEAGLKKAATDAKRFGNQVSLVANDLARSITDLIFKGGKLKDVMVGVFTDMGKALVRSALEQQFKNLIGMVADLLGKIPKLGKALDAVFGAGTTGSSAASKIPGGAPQVPGASPAGGVAGAAGSGLAGTVTAIAGVGTLISSIVGNFQFAGMNKSLDLIVKHTLQTANQLIQGIQPQVNAYLPLLASIHDRLATVTTQGIGVYNAPNDAGLRLAGGAGGGGNFTFNFTNVTFGPGTSADSIKSAFTEAARQMAAAGAV